MKKKTARLEFVLITVFLLIALVVLLIAFGMDEMKTNELRFQFHDTYLVFPTAIGVGVLFLVQYFVATPIRLAYRTHSRLTQWIVYLGALFFIVWISWFFLSPMSSLVRGSFGNSGWTVYPPLSALSKVMKGPEPNILAKVMIGVQVYAMILSILVTTRRPR